MSSPLLSFDCRCFDVANTTLLCFNHGCCFALHARLGWKLSLYAHYVVLVSFLPLTYSTHRNCILFGQFSMTHHITRRFSFFVKLSLLWRPKTATKVKIKVEKSCCRKITRKNFMKKIFCKRIFIYFFLL